MSLLYVVKKRFLASATVRDFQQAAVSKVKYQSSGDVVAEVMIPFFAW